MVQKLLCVHVNDAVLAVLKKITSIPDTCNAAHTITEKDSVPIWVCQCGFTGCSRYSANQCMLKHAESKRHSICVNLEENIIWCYSCDIELHEQLTENETFFGAKVYKQLEEKVEKINQLVYRIKQRQKNQLTAQLVGTMGLGKATGGLPRLGGGGSGYKDIMKKDNVFGLVNLGNTCFFNAVAQIMLSSPPFLEQLSRHRHLMPPGSMSDSFLQLNGGSDERVRNPKSLFARLVRENKMYGYYNQQDSHECFINITEALEKEYSACGVQGDLPFVGYFTYNSQCLNCGSNQFIFEKTYNVLLDLCKNHEYSAVRHKLHERLKVQRLESPQQQFVRLDNTEIVDNKNVAAAGIDRDKDVIGINSWWADLGPNTCNFRQRVHEFFDYNIHSYKDDGYQCEKCKTKSSYGFTKYFIARPPQVFVICLKRFTQNSLAFSKMNKKIDIPAELDLTRYCLLINKEGYDRSARYELYGAVQHNGSLRGGHYTCYVKKESSNWYYMSDTHFRAVNEQQALSSDAYLLFYKRIHQG